jgi:hypothetical protein
LKKEREKHQAALKALEDRLVENFVMVSVFDVRIIGS